MLDFIFRMEHRPGMNLADWLKSNRVTRVAFAARIGVSPSYVTGLCSGAYWPGREVIKRITQETNGAVTANDFLNHEVRDDA